MHILHDISNLLQFCQENGNNFILKKDLAGYTVKLALFQSEQHSIKTLFWKKE